MIDEVNAPESDYHVAYSREDIEQYRKKEGWVEEQTAAGSIFQKIWDCPPEKGGHM